MAGPDHWFSADPQELSSLVREVRRLEANFGKGRLCPSEAEKGMADLCRRSIVTARDLPEGYMITEADLAFKRPGTGILPYDINKVVGKRTREPLSMGRRIEVYDLENADEQN